MVSGMLARLMWAFVVGPGHASIPGKLVSKITNGQFVDLADLLLAEQEPQTLMVSCWFPKSVKWKFWTF